MIARGHLEFARIPPAPLPDSPAFVRAAATAEIERLARDLVDRVTAPLGHPTTEADARRLMAIRDELKELVSCGW